MKKVSCLVVIATMFMLSFTDKKAQQDVPAPGSRYYGLTVLDDFPYNSPCAFDLKDSLDALDFLLRLSAMGWEDLDFYSNEKMDKICVWPAGGSATLGLGNKLMYIDGHLYRLREGYINRYSKDENSYQQALISANKLVELYSDEFKIPLIYTEIISIMEFPGDKNQIQVKFAAAYDETKKK